MVLPSRSIRRREQPGKQRVNRQEEKWCCLGERISCGGKLFRFNLQNRGCMCTKRLSGNKKDSTLQMTKHDLYLADEASSPVDDVYYHTLWIPSFVGVFCCCFFTFFLKICLINDNLPQCLASHLKLCSPTIQIFMIHMCRSKLGQKGEEAFIIIAYKWSTLGVPDYNNPIQSYLELIFCM